MKKLSYLMLLLLFTFSSCQNSEPISQPTPLVEDAPMEENNVPEKNITEEDNLDFDRQVASDPILQEVPPKDEKDTSPVTEESNPLETEMATFGEKILTEAFLGIAKVEFISTEKTYFITPTGENFIAELVSIIDGETDIAVWNQLVYALVELSYAFHEDIGEGYSIVLLSPEDETEILVYVSDGLIVYDIIYD